MSAKLNRLPDVQEALSVEDRNKLVTDNLDFVAQLARRMDLPGSIDVQDLVQDGVFGLMEAAERFDPSRAIKFTTFAEPRVRGAMIDALRKDAWPRGVRKLRRQIQDVRHSVREETGFEATDAEIATALDRSERMLQRQLMRIRIIEATGPNSEHIAWADLPPIFLPTLTRLNPEEIYGNSEKVARLENAIDTLPLREQRVIMLYYRDEVSMKDIGTRIGVNESRVSQLHARALRRLSAILNPGRPVLTPDHFSPPRISTTEIDLEDIFGADLSELDE